MTIKESIVQVIAAEPQYMLLDVDVTKIDFACSHTICIGRVTQTNPNFLGTTGLYLSKDECHEVNFIPYEAVSNPRCYEEV